MKIALVNQPLGLVMPSEGPTGSIAVVVDAYARHLAPTNDVIVYCRTHDDLSDIRIERAYGAEFRGIPCDHDAEWTRRLQRWDKRVRVARKKLGLPQPRLPFFASWLYHYDFMRRVARDIARQKPDIVHCQNFSQIVPIIRAHNPHTKIVLQMHDKWLALLDRDVVEKRIRQADMVLGCSDYITNQIRARFPHLADRCDTVFNGVDTQRFFTKNDAHDAPHPPTLLYLGRVSPEKGVHTILEAFPSIAARVPGVRLNIVGSRKAANPDFIVNLTNEPTVTALNRFYQMDYQAHLEALIPDALKDRVTFTGNVAHDEVIKFMHTADVFLHPSLSEALGISVAEAIACGLPVVATRVGGLPEVVLEGQNGLLVEPDDAPALAEAAIALLCDPGRRATMAQVARQHAETAFSWERLSEKLYGLYERLLGMTIADTPRASAPTLP